MLTAPSYSVTPLIECSDMTKPWDATVTSLLHLKDIMKTASFLYSLQLPEDATNDIHHIICMGTRYFHHVRIFCDDVKVPDTEQVSYTYRKDLQPLIHIEQTDYSNDETIPRQLLIFIGNDTDYDDYRYRIVKCYNVSCLFIQLISPTQ